MFYPPPRATHVHRLIATTLRDETLTAASRMDHKCRSRKESASARDSSSLASTERARRPSRTHHSRERRTPTARGADRATEDESSRDGGSVPGRTSDREPTRDVDERHVRGGGTVEDGLADPRLEPDARRGRVGAVGGGTEGERAGGEGRRRPTRERDERSARGRASWGR